jgi:predicted PurR-regulated permease PerM
MAKKFTTKFFKESSKQIKKLTDAIKNLKEEHEELEEEKKFRSKKPKKDVPEEMLVSFSLASVAKATLVVLGLVLLANFLGEILNIIIIFFISLLFAAALDPTVDALEKRKIPRAISVIAILLFLIFILGFFISQLVPLIATQLFELAKNLTTILDKLTTGEWNIPFSENIQGALEDFIANIDQQLIIDRVKDSLETLGAQLQSLAGNTVGAIVTIFNGILNFFMVLILTFFLVVHEEGVDDFFISLFPSRHGKYIIEKLETVKKKVGDWLRGQMIMIFLMFSLTLTGLLILGIDYALTLAMMAGIAELLPVVGPILAGIPAILVGFNESPWLAIWVFGLIIVLQQLEGNVLIPMVMKKAVGLNPIIVILAMLVGYETLGIIGIIIAIPVATTLSIFVGEYISKKK